MAMTKALPIGLTDFANLIDTNKIYVDKSDLAADLASYQGTFFLARPRRFGKSTLISTFHELFAHGTQRFKGLKLDTENLWQDHTYPVVRLSFSSIVSPEEYGLTFAQYFSVYVRKRIQGCIRHP